MFRFSSLLLLCVAFPALAAESGRIISLDARTLFWNVPVHEWQAPVHPIVLAEDKGDTTTIDLPADILFDFDKSDLRPDAEDALKEAARLIDERHRRYLRIDGHTDGKGSAAYNQKLSERRAEAVRNWFARAEPGLKMTTRGLGARLPVAPERKPDGSDDPEGRQRNRRVQLVLTTRP